MRVTGSGPAPGPEALPVAVRWQGGEPVVTWCDFEDLAFTDPFFYDTYARLQRTRPGHRTWQTDAGPLLDRAARGEGLTPSGFVYHMGRCGSTLTSRLLAGSGQCLVMSEPEAMVGLLDFPAQVPADERRALVEAMIRVLGRPRQPDQRHYVVKFTSFHVFHLDLVAELFPHTPWVFVFREPLAVIRSMLATPPGFLQLRDAPSEVARLLGLPPAAATTAPAEFAARILIELLAIPLQRADRVREGVAACIDHSSLPSSVWSRIAPLFEIQLSEDDIRAMAELGGAYSKDPTGQQRYVPTPTPLEGPDPAGDLSAMTRHVLDQCWRELAALAQVPSPPALEAACDSCSPA